MFIPGIIGSLANGIVAIGSTVAGTAGTTALADGSIISAGTTAAAVDASTLATEGAAAGALTEIGGATSALSAGMQANAANKAAEFNANAAKKEADQAELQGQVAEQQQRMKTAATVGSATAAYGASGVDTNTGSAAQTNAQTQQIGEFDALTTRANAMNQASALRTQAQAYQASEVSPFLAAGASGLQSFSSSINNRYMRQLYASGGGQTYASGS